MSRTKLYTGMIGLLATFFLLPVQARITSTDIELVDLGLSVKWASMNIDATATSGAGDFYAWGEVNTKSDYSWETYAYCSGSSATCKNIGSNISGNARYDRAYDYSTRFCLPTAAQWNELISQCTWKETTVDGVKGYNVKGPSGKSIFLPFSGCSYDGGSHGVGSYAYYWTSNNVAGEVSKAQAGYIKSGTKTAVSKINRRTGASIRAVSNPKYTELVDLGLSVMWASTNIDASNMSETGGFYAWGEITTKSNYSWDTYTLCSGTAASCKDIGSNISGNIRYDRAYNFSNKLSLPTVEQWNELISQCTWKETTVDGVKGYNVKGPSGKSIFLPFSGCSYDGGSHGTGSNAYYWSSNNVPGEVSKAQAAYIKSGTKTAISKINRRTGTAIRPVATTYSKSKQYALYNYRNDRHFNAWLNIDVDSITYSCVDTLGVEHDDIVVQEVWTPDSLYRIPIEAIDSIGFRAPAPVMQDGIFFLRDYHAAHTVAIDSLTLFFDKKIKNDSLPAIGQVVLHGVFTHPYEEGFAGKVKSIRNENGNVVVDCEMLCVADVYKRLVMAGSAITESASGMKAKPRRAKGDPWVKYEDSDEIIDDIGDIKLKVLDGLFFANSINPTLKINYSVYVDEDFYDMSATVRLTHNDLEYGIDLNLNKILAIEDTIAADKEWKIVTQALQRMQNYKNMSHENWVKSIVEETKKKGDKEKVDKDQASLLKTMWDKLHKTWTIPIGGPFVVDLEVGPLLDLKGSIDILGNLKTKARNTIYIEAKGSTVATLSNPSFALSTGLAKINGSSDFYIEPAHSVSLGLKAKGSLDVGIMGKASISLIHKGVVHATGSFKGGLKLAGEIGFSWDSESAYSEDFSLYNMLYDGVKDTKIKLEAFACAGVELGVTPWKFLTAGAEWEIWKNELGSCYLFPHFSKPSLPTYDHEKDQWSNGNSNNHVVLQSLPTKNIPDFLLGPCKVGLKIFGKNGNSVKETDEREYRDDGTLVWQLFPLEIDLKDLTPGETYRCYPVLRYHDWWQLGASPSYEFTVPQPVSLEVETIHLKKGDSKNVQIIGGWGDFLVFSSNPSVCSAELKKEGDNYYLEVVGKSNESAMVTVKDLRTNDIKVLLVKVSDEDDQHGSAEDLQLSTTSLTLTPGSKGTVDVTSGSGSYAVKSSNTNVATATREGSKVTITAVAVGSAVITVKDQQTNQTADIQVTVSEAENSYLTCPDDHHPHLIDLGLPSGTKWACCNVDDDASKQSPTNYGSYYAWGETKEHDDLIYNWSTYTHCDGSWETCHDLGSDIAGTRYDVAHVKWGGSWVMPSEEQQDELKKNCNYEWMTVNGVEGGKFTSKVNGGSIFLPAAGCRDDSGLYNAGSGGYYWSSTQDPSDTSGAYYLYFSSSGASTYYRNRYYGPSVRPVVRN